MGLLGPLWKRVVSTCPLFVYQVNIPPTLARPVSGSERIRWSPLTMRSGCVVLHLTCTLPTAHCCYTRGLRAVWCG